ncbi:hypothetical protein [Herbaspirillum camelliae]|uniref:hypothetical protein n=1 Tax=Herbaspirillum camelliae TaxID=1892903 RepID=UPI000AC9A070|nr:hypothetical protein [Herbaspirillum camelliae]
MTCISMRVLALSALTFLALPAWSADWSTTDLEYRYGTQYNDNGGTGGPHIAKHMLQVQNASGFSLGRSYFFLLMSTADNADNNSGDLYSEGSATLSLSKIAGQKIAFGPISDVGLTGGYNFGSRNTTYGPNTRALLFGPTFDFSLPGFSIASIDVLAYRDNGRYSGFGGGRICGQGNTTYQITPYWLNQFTVGRARFEFGGYTDFIGSHGTCSQQILTEVQLRLDVGEFWGVRDKFFAGIEIQHWRNKFGVSGVKETVPQLVLRWRL